jgi:nitroreductase
MQVFDAIRTVLAVRQFQDQPVPPETVRRILEAGWLTASSMNQQPWHFIAVEERATLQRLGELARTGPYIAGAALAVVVVIEKTRFAVSDASRAIQSMILAGWGEGVGSNWVGFGEMQAANALLGIPDGLEIFAILPFGYPAKRIGLGKKKRKPFEQVAHREKFGQAFG